MARRRGDSADGDADTDGDGADEPEVEITFGHSFPGEHPMAVNMLDPWMEEVEERTGGSVTFDVHPGGAITTLPLCTRTPSLAPSRPSSTTPR